MSAQLIFAFGAFVSLLCVLFVAVSALEIRRLQQRAPSDDGRWFASK